MLLKRNRLLTYIILPAIISSIIAGIFYYRLGVLNVTGKNFVALNYCGDSKEYNDIVFIGGSRAQRHINPAIIDSINGTNSYCASLAGAGIVEANLLLNKYLQNHPKPKVIFLNIDYNMFFTGKILYNITDYFPYLNDTLVYRCISPYKAVYRSKAMQYFYYVRKMFALTDDGKESRLFDKPFSNEDPEVSAHVFRGFVPLERDWGAGAEKEANERKMVPNQPQGYSLLKKMVKQCNTDSIKVIFLMSPMYYKYSTSFINGPAILKKINTIAAETNTPVWDYTDMYISRDKNFFYNIIHMNLKGSVIYSRQLALDIKQQLH